MLLRVFWCCILACPSITGAFAQVQFRGVVWDSDAPPTVHDLVEISQAGIRAVRLPLLSDTTVLAYADSLGLHLFQDLPIRYLPAASLHDSLEFSTEQLLAAIRNGVKYNSARHYGLANYSDTSNKAGVQVF